MRGGDFQTLEAYQYNYVSEAAKLLKNAEDWVC